MLIKRNRTHVEANHSSLIAPIIWKTKVLHHFRYICCHSLFPSGNHCILLFHSFSHRQLQQMASGVENKITQQLECAICWDKFKEPKVLSCQHTFCRECLEELVIEAGTCVTKCPVCRRTTLVRHVQTMFTI